MVVQWQVGCMLVEMQPGCCRVLELRMSLQKQSRLSASYWVMEVLQGGMPACTSSSHACVVRAGHEWTSELTKEWSGCWGAVAVAIAIYRGRAVPTSLQNMVKSQKASSGGIVDCIKLEGCGLRGSNQGKTAPTLTSKLGLAEIVC